MITSVLSGLIAALGLAIIVRTLLSGTGGGLGLLIGVLFVLAGAGRLYLQHVRQRRSFR
jgi:hypothetical protein